jgi:metal-responsive CopG/Arc/MetJ family transcriptional regulator
MKVAISLPDQVFDAAERVARDMKVSRSQLYAEALAAFVAERSAASVTEQLNAVYDCADAKLDPVMAEVQARSISDETW